MTPVFHAALRAWSVPPAATLAILLTAVTYLRGRWLLRSAGFPGLPTWRAACFVSGLLCLWIALASPLDTFSGFLLTAHMLQHLALMMLAPPLILLGEPLIPMVRGIPRFAAREFAGPLLNSRTMQRIGRLLIHPVFTLLLMAAVMFAWHVPALYQLALRSSAWHEFEHGCFFFASLLFWWPLIQPWPSHAWWPRWAMVPYLLIADLQNTILSAILVFSDRLLYPAYGLLPTAFGASPLQDQVAAGAIMWVMGSLVFIVPAVMIAVRGLGRPAPLSSPAFERNRTHRAANLRMLTLRRFGYPRLSPEVIEAASFLLLFVAVAAPFTWSFSIPDDDDNQTIRLQQQTGALMVTVLAPEDLAAGDSQFSVLVQDAATGQPLPDARVQFSTASAGATPATWIKAGHEDSANPLLQSAEMNLAEGNETIYIAVENGAQSVRLTLPVEAIAQTTGIADYWPRLLFPLIGLLLLMVYGWRHRVRARRPAPQPLSPASPS